MINILSGIDSTSSALNAERIRMDVVSENIANANTTRGLDGKPYQRQQVVFEAVLSAQQAANGTQGMEAGGTRVVRIEPDQRPPQMVFNPQHPHADAVQPCKQQHAEDGHAKRQVSVLSSGQLVF